MKNIYLFILTLAVALSACTEPDEVATAEAAGGIVTVEYSGGKVLGIPQADESVDFRDVVLSLEMDVPVYQKATGVASYTIVKRLIQENATTDWVEIETINAMPYSLSYTTIAEFVAGMGVAETALRIGDVFEFTARLNLTNGSIEWPSTSYGVLSLTVNCVSDLAGIYDLFITRGDGGTLALAGMEIFEISPGYYKTTTSGTWAVGSISPDHGMNFNDVCNVITVPAQDLHQGNWGNDVSQAGDANESFANPTTGEIQIKYSISFGSGPQEYTHVYTPAKKKFFYNVFDGEANKTLKFVESDVK